MASSKEIKTTLCRLSFADGLFTIKEGRIKFGCTLVFPKSDTVGRAALESICMEAIKAEWGDKGVEQLKLKMIKTPFFDGDGVEARIKKGEKAGELYSGMGPDVWFVRVGANPDRPPAVRWKNPNIQETESNVYSGCYGKGVVNAFTSDHETGGRRVSIGISMFQKTAEGERLGGSGPIDPEKFYETIEDTGAAPDATKNGGGASSLFGDS